MLVSAGFLIVWLPPDVRGFRPVLARGWHGLCLSIKATVTLFAADRVMTGKRLTWLMVFPVVVLVLVARRHILHQ